MEKKGMNEKPKLQSKKRVVLSEMTRWSGGKHYIGRVNLIVISHQEDGHNSL